MATQTKTEVEKQREYAQALADKGFGYDLVVGAAFVRGMRDLGYKNTGTAMDEIIDNSIEAGAKTVAITFKTEKSDKKPDAIAIIDDGHGMPAEMLRASVMWGGTHRENSRKGIGRYGYGLPSASVSQAKRFTVYSKPKEEDWHFITIDLEDISDGKYTENGRIVTPEPKKVALPDWLKKDLKKHFSKDDLPHGTIVVWEKLDRLSWSTISGLSGKLLEHFGLTYRNYISQTKIKVGDTNVEPIDPLFITPGFRHFDIDEDRAQALEPMRVSVKIPDSNEKATVTIRFASFPRTFGAENKNKDAGRGNANARWHIMNDHKGIVVSRMGRQIDTVTRTPTEWKSVSSITGNNDRYWGVEIDFPAELDEEFSVTTAKQRIEISERMWEILTQNGLERSIRSLKQAIESEQKKEKEKQKDPNEARPSEKIMSESEKFRHTIPGETSEERERLSQEAFENEVKRKKSQEKKSEEQVRKELTHEASQRPYKVEFEDLPSGPFYRAEQRGPQFVIFINRKHSFYSSLYAAEDSNAKIQAALELLLFTLGTSEMDAIGNKDKELFYKTERVNWSKKLDIAFELLSSMSSFSNEEDVDKESPQEEAA